MASSLAIPPLRVDRIENILVVRDDRVPGGTKRRALQQILKADHEYVYASPASGFAQVALAYSAADAGATATIFTAKRKLPHPNTIEAKQAGARVVMVPTGYLSNVTAKARAYAEQSGAELLPFGFGSESFLRAIAQLAGQLPIDQPPIEVWCVAGSGTLAKGLMLAWPEAEFHVVAVGAALDLNGAKEIVLAPEKFEDVAKEPPAFPSSLHYDAKAWRFIKEKAAQGALFWNVAG